MAAQLDIIYEDKEMIVCNKPAGVLAQSDRSFAVDMVSSLMAYRKQKGEDTYIGVINRLDRNVSGLMVFAKSSKSAGKLNKLMQAQTFNKNYYALVPGKLEEEAGMYEDYLIKNGKTNMSTVCKSRDNGAKQARLEYEVVEYREKENVSLVRIKLLTGRHHQIRVQFASRGHALIGDTKYGTSEGASRIMLEAYSLDIEGKHLEIPCGI